MNSFRMRGKKGRRHADPADPPRRRANQRRGHGTYSTDRPPVFILVARHSKEVRYAVRERTDGRTCLDVLIANLTHPDGQNGSALAPTDGLRTVGSHLSSDEWKGYASAERVLSLSGLRLVHQTVHHGRDASGRRQWARDADGDGRREVHCNSCEGAGSGLRTYLRPFRGVHKYYLAEYVACYETMTNAKRITAEVLRRMCFGITPKHPNYT